MTFRIEKTLAEIARAAWMNAGNLEDHWEITAAAVRNAVIEECARKADEIEMDYRERAAEARNRDLTIRKERLIDYANSAMSCGASIRSLKTEASDG